MTNTEMDSMAESVPSPSHFLEKQGFIIKLLLDIIIIYTCSLFILHFKNLSKAQTGPKVWTGY